MEIRAIQNSDLTTRGNLSLTGYAAMFNQLSEQLQGFRETVKPGAFTRSIQSRADVRALVDHDPRAIIGRTVAGTLHLSEDSHGLLCQIDLPDTSVGRDLFTSVSRGDISQMSFGFTVVSDKWPSRDRRELWDVNLIDVSVVTFPAYPQTSVSVRGLGNLGWYVGDSNKSLRTVAPTVSELEKLRLMLRLAQMI